MEPLPFQIGLGKVLLGIIPSLSADKTLAIFNAAKSLLGHKAEDVSRVWRDVYILCINKIPDDEIRREVLPEIMLDGGLRQPATQRVWCARLLGAVAHRIEGKKMEQLLFPKASQLCQDTDYEVRKAMAKEMPSLIKSLGLKQSRKTIFPEFMELLIDEEASVQQAALKHFMDLAEIFDGE
ncbi:Serine/threonine-protein phosphatase 4 regulatory subunit 4, partial [Kappamyces sp. JEL0680]